MFGNDLDRVLERGGGGGGEGIKTRGQRDKGKVRVLGGAGRGINTKGQTRARLGIVIANKENCNPNGWSVYVEWSIGEGG